MNKKEDNTYKYMHRAFVLAQKGEGGVNPNPLVGAVIVKNDIIIGEGYHEYCGGPHAEINALASASESVQGATMYVSLEPCSHYGKTPPCAKAIIENKISEVVIGMLDPNPLVSGRGVKMLQEVGIKVSHSYLLEDFTFQNRVFLKYIQKKLPYVVMKTAMTLDGKIAAYTGDSRWVSNSKSRAKVHSLRMQLSAIMVGIQTVIADDPMLNTRIEGKEARNPIRIIVDSSARLPLDTKLANSANEIRTILAVAGNISDSKRRDIEAKGIEIIICKSINNRVDIKDLMINIAALGIDSILLEGGATLNFSAIESGIVDEIMAFIAPKIIGGATAKTPVGGQGFERMNQALELKNIKVSQFDDDILIQAFLN